MKQKNPPWANWGAMFFVNGKEITKFYKTESRARISVSILRLRHHKDVLLFQIIREEYRIFQDFIH